MYYVYILKCKDGSLYTGITTDVVKRLAKHKAGTASRYTRSRGAVRMVYTEKRASKGAALKREYEIKGYSRDKKLALARSRR